MNEKNKRKKLQAITSQFFFLSLTIEERKFFVVRFQLLLFKQKQFAMTHVKYVLN